MSKVTAAHFERFPSEFHMLKFFGKYLPKLDVMASARMVPGVYSYDGKIHATRNFWQFLTEMEQLTDLGIDLKSSTIRFSQYIVFFNKNLKSAEDFVNNSAPVVTSSLLTTKLPEENQEVNTDLGETAEITPPVIDTPPEGDDQGPEEGQKEATPPTEPQDGVDVAAILAQAEALRDENAKAASKAALEAFGLTHGASLSKAKTFDNMLEDLKAHLSK